MSDFYEAPAQEQASRLEALAREALPRFGLENASLSLIKHRENAVFRADPDGGEPVIVRVHRYAYHGDAELLSELQWMQALTRDGIPTPPIVPARSGALFEIVRCDAVPEPRQVDVFGWVDGEGLGTIEGGAADRASLERNYRTLGSLAARLHDHAEHWKRPADFARHAWDLDGLLGEAPFWGRFWDLELLTPAQRELLGRAIGRTREELSAFGTSPDRYGLIHADLLAENVLVDGDVMRVIDFDDAGFGWHLFDLATTLFFLQLEDGVFEPARDALVAGYREVRALPDDQLEKLPLFVLQRGFTYLGWCHTRKETQTAQELAPAVIELVVGLTEEHLSR
jgi:Ser/Thr protein kinase RdoA (MazF antagonist)